jgi:hypothetical protein
MEGTMAIAERASQSQRIPSQKADGPDVSSPIARLAILHAEAKDTARLANLLGRSIHAAAALAAMGAATLIFAGPLSATSIVWSGFLLVAVGAIALAFRRTMKQPFERAALKSFSRDLDAIMAFAGTAWGAGAFLTLPTDVDFVTLILFSAGACAIVAVLLREYESTLHFLAPTAALASFACVLRPLPGSALAAALVLTACAAVAALFLMAARWSNRAQSATELAQLPFA